MIMHIVMLKFHEDVAEAVKEEIRVQVEQLIDLVPGLLNMKVGMNFAQEERAMDMVLISHFSDRDDLDFYASHPEHLKVIDQIKIVAKYTKVVDFEA